MNCFKEALPSINGNVWAIPFFTFTPFAHPVYKSCRHGHVENKPLDEEPPNNKVRLHGPKTMTAAAHKSWLHNTLDNIC